jgi:hypothetical protein
LFIAAAFDFEPGCGGSAVAEEPMLIANERLGVDVPMRRVPLMHRHDLWLYKEPAVMLRARSDIRLFLGGKGNRL